MTLFDIALLGNWSMADHKMDAAGPFVFQILVRPPSMAANLIVDPPFLGLLSTQHTIQDLDNFISASALFAAVNPEHEHPSYHDPSMYHIRQINIIKRQFQPVQHEGIILTIRRQGLPPAENFYLLINRDITFIRGIFTCFLSRNLAIDSVAYIPRNSATRLPFDTALWTMTMNQDGLTLAQVPALLSSISGTDQYYHLFERNCYWYTRVFTRLITRIAPQAEGAWEINEHMNHSWYHRLGSWLGIVQVDGSQHPEANEEVSRIENMYNYRYNQLMNRVHQAQTQAQAHQAQAQQDQAQG